MPLVTDPALDISMGSMNVPILFSVNDASSITLNNINAAITCVLDGKQNLSQISINNMLSIQ